MQLNLGSSQQSITDNNFNIKNHIPKVYDVLNSSIGSTRTLPINIKNTKPAIGLYAGAQFQNSPDPSALPIPTFSSPLKTPANKLKHTSHVSHSQDKNPSFDQIFPMDSDSKHSRESVVAHQPSPPHYKSEPPSPQHSSSFKDPAILSKMSLDLKSLLNIQK